MDILDIEKSKCIGCGACISIDEEHFDWDSDGLSMVISQNNLKSEPLTSAIESCPTGAIRLAKTDDCYETNDQADFGFDKNTIMASSNKETA